MPYHGLEHESRQPEEVIRWVRYISKPPVLVFSNAIGRNDAIVHDEMLVSETRTVVLNPYWRADVEEAGLGYLIDEGHSHAAPAPEPLPRAHMYDVMWRLAKAGIFILALAVVAITLVIIGRVNH